MKESICIRDCSLYQSIAFAAVFVLLVRMPLITIFVTAAAWLMRRYLGYGGRAGGTGVMFLLSLAVCLLARTLAGAEISATAGLLLSGAAAAVTGIPACGHGQYGDTDPVIIDITAVQDDTENAQRRPVRRF